MTQKDAPHDFDPKHRILGAIVIVALAVIFVPMILSERDPPETVAPPNGETQAPMPVESENKVAVTRVPPPNASAEPAKSSSASVAEAPKAPPAPRPDPSSAPAAKPGAPKATAPSETNVASSSGWIVQVGTFANATNATRLEQKLRANGQPVRAERVQLDSGKAVRLRVGPFRERATALKAQERIQKETGIKGVVLAYP